SNRLQNVRPRLARRAKWRRSLPLEARQYLAVLLPRTIQFLGIDPEDAEDGRGDLPSLHIIVDGRRIERWVRYEQGNVAVVRDEEAAMFRQFRPARVDQTVYCNGNEVRGAVVAKGVAVKRREVRFVEKGDDSQGAGLGQEIGLGRLIVTLLHLGGQPEQRH